MKKINLLITVIGLVLMSFSINKNNPVIKQATDVSCWWNMTNSSAVDTRRGASCGSDSSLKVYFTNPYTYRVRVAFYLRNTDGSLKSGSPHVISVAAGRRIYHHNCYSNGQYNILVARYDARCSFPKL